MPTYKNGTPRTIQVEAITFTPGEEKSSGKYLRRYPTVGVGYLTTCAVRAAGSGYTDEEIVTVGGTGTDGTIELTVDRGAVTGVEILAAGYGYTAGNGVATSYDGDGVGCTVDITVTPFGIIDADPIIAPFSLVQDFSDLPGTSNSLDVAKYDTIHVFNGTDEAAYVTFNGAELDKFYLEIGERYDFENFDQRIGSIKVSGTADTGSIYVLGGGSLATPTVGG